jgi:hypothetical protein
VTEQLEPADALLQGLKAKVDEGLKDDAQLQSFLRWVQGKSSSVSSKLNAWEVRNFYLAIDLNRTLAFTLSLALDFELSFALALDFELSFALARALALDFELSFTLDFELDFTFDFALALDPKFKEQLQQLRDVLPDSSEENFPNFQAWWKSNGEEWTNNLRQLAIKYRNIGHDWQFTEEQSQKLVQYYKANQLLIDCLNSECRISRSVREEIEDSVFNDRRN